jgi:hypothetical protein
MKCENEGRRGHATKRHWRLLVVSLLGVIMNACGGGGGESGTDNNNGGGGAKVNHAPVASNDAATTREDTTILIPVLANDEDSDGTLVATTAALTVLPQHGTAVLQADGRVLYTPMQDYSDATDSFEYRVSDDDGATSNPARVDVTVTPVNDPPTAGDDSWGTREDDAFSIYWSDNDTDRDGEIDLDSFTIVQSPLHGSIVVQGAGVIEYTPAPDYPGPEDHFSYTVSDTEGAVSAEAVIDIVISPSEDLPVAADDVAETLEDTPVVIDVAMNDGDVDGNLDPAAAQILTLPAHGSAVVLADGKIEYTPALDYQGPEDQFAYLAYDAVGDSSAQYAQVTVTILPVNDVPAAQDDSAEIHQYQFARMNVFENDSLGDGPATILELGTPEHGTVTDDGDGLITYYPDRVYLGEDSFSYKVADADGETADAVARITIGPGQMFRIFPGDRLARLIVESSFIGLGSDATVQGWVTDLLTEMQDDFDYILLIQDCRNCFAEFAGINYTVRNDIEGIGRDHIDQGYLWGSDGRLQSVVYLTNLQNLRGGPSLHELLHNFANYIIPANYGSPGHWNFAGTPGQLGGFDPATLVDLGGGHYQATNGRPGETSFGISANGGNALPYSTHELYLMGLVPASEVPPLLVAIDPVGVDGSNGLFDAAAFDEVTIEDIVDEFGPRNPAFGMAPTNFKVLTVVVFRWEPPDEDWQEIDRDLAAFADPAFDDDDDLYNFYEATGGRATLEVDGLSQHLRTVNGAGVPPPMNSASEALAGPADEPDATALGAPPRHVQSSSIAD